MRFAVFVFSILLIFNTTYAHAIAFVPAAVGGLVRMAGGQVMKVASKRGVVATASVALALYCKKNQKKCKDIIGDTLGDYFFGDDDEQYDGCVFKMFYSSLHNYSHHQYHDQLSDAINASYSFISGVSNRPVDEIERKNKEFIAAKENLKKHAKQFKNSTLDYSFTMQHFRYDSGFQSSIQVGMHYKLACDDEAQEELAKKIAEHLSDDDIDQIINNYSKEIEINIDKYCGAPGACTELEQSFGDEVMNNKSKYDIDKINKDNCEVKNGKITSCDKAKKDTDDDDSDTPKEPKKPDDGKDGDDDNDSSSNDKDDNKINCEASAFHKKVCDFIDWYQDDADLKDGDKVEIKELSNELKIDNDKVSFGRVCPSGKTVSIGFGNIKIVKQLSYQGLCDAFIKMKPFVIGIGCIVGAMIVVGRRV